MALRENQSAGLFSFQVSLWANGDITIVYEDVIYFESLVVYINLFLDTYFFGWNKWSILFLQNW